MKTHSIFSLVMGLVIGSLLTYQLTKSGSTSEPERRERELEVKNDLVPDVQNEEKKTEKQIETNNSVQQQVGATDVGAPPAPDRMACFEKLKPSDIVKWQTLWQEKVATFISSNDSFWDSKGHRSFDARVFPSVQGKYKGTWTVSSNPSLKAEYKVELLTDIDGVVTLSLEDLKDSTTSNCSDQMFPKKSMGFDEKENAVNIFMNNCNPRMLDPDLSQFAFKIPLGMQKGQQKRVEIFGLTEDFSWKSSGTLDLIKL